MYEKFKPEPAEAEEKGKWGRRAYHFVMFQGLGDSFFSQN